MKVNQNNPTDDQRDRKRSPLCLLEYFRLETKTLHLKITILTELDEHNEDKLPCRGSFISNNKPLHSIMIILKGSLYRISLTAIR